MNPSSMSTISPYRQFPMRLDQKMYDELDLVCKQTRITKTEISRVALRKFLNELQNSGVTQYLDKVCSV